ncbi:MAG: endolytic transglycosylase MltG [Promicromonosporaceae bacterium]|nr:endolytic transglycosylase MltG [Promicromonosporaceae bacterium]
MSDLFPTGTPQATQASATPTVHRIGAARARADRRRRRRRITALILIPAFIAVLIPFGRNLLDENSNWGRGLFASFAAPPIEDFEGPAEGEVVVTIPAGATGSLIGQILFDAEVVASVAAFNEAFGDNPDAGGIQPGAVRLYRRMPAADAVAMLTLNERMITRITFPENFTQAQIFARIEAQTDIPQSQLDAVLADPSLIGLPPEAEGEIEGWLFPATYDLVFGETAVSLLSSMVTRTVSELERLEVPAEQWRDTIIKASIIEREAPVFRGEGVDDPTLYMRKVSQVIQNRLAINEPLGMDAIDAFYHGRPAHRISPNDLRDATNPWASRVNPGLPPGPIGSASADALYAVVNPEPGPWRWFVTIDLCTRETFFTDSYQQFLVYRQAHREWRAENPTDDC